MAAIYDILTRDEWIEFSSKNSPRAKAIVLGAIVENHLNSAIKFAFHKDEKTWNELFQPSGPLGDFRTKIRLAYMARVITDTNLKKDLLTVAKIRNRFAHDISTTRFDDQPVRQWIKNMYSYGRIKQIAESKPEPGHSSFVRARMEWMRETKRKALRSMSASYLEALGQILHELIVNVEDVHRAKSEGTPKRDYPFGSSGAGKMDLLPRASRWRASRKKS